MPNPADDPQPLEIPKLTAPVPIVEFTAAQQAECREFLGELTDKTTLYAIRSPEDLQLTEEGRFCRSGYRLSPLALQQICTRISAGLYQLVLDVGGQARRIGRYDEVVSQAAAVRILNELTRLRFRATPGLMNCKLVVNAANQTAEGLVGQKYYFLAHSTLYDTVAEILAEMDPQADFFAGRLVGRRFSFLYADPRSLFALPSGDQFHYGYYVVNSEAGECGIKVAPMLQVRMASGDVWRALGHARRLSHVGKNFSLRLRKMIRSVSTDDEQRGQLEPMVRKLQQTPLNLLTAERKLRREWAEGVRKKLVKRGVEANAAQEALRWAVYAGAYGTRIPRQVDVNEVAQRTAYDVFIAMLRTGENFYPRVRELLEHNAFDLLLEKLHV